MYWPCAMRCPVVWFPWQYCHSWVYLSEWWPLLLHFPTIVIAVYINIKESSSGQFIQKWHRRAGGIPEANRAIFMPRKRRIYRWISNHSHLALSSTKSCREIKFSSTGRKCRQTQEFKIYPVSRMSFVKDSAPATFPPLIGQSWIKTNNEMHSNIQTLDNQIYHLITIKINSVTGTHNTPVSCTIQNHINLTRCNIFLRLI
jgi:hypothetical protein